MNLSSFVAIILVDLSTVFYYLPSDPIVAKRETQGFDKLDLALLKKVPMCPKNITRLLVE